MDNYYNSEAMAKFLKSCNRGCVGTVKTNRKAVTMKLQESKLQKNDAVTQLDGPDCFLGMA